MINKSKIVTNKLSEEAINKLFMQILYIKLLDSNSIINTEKILKIVFL